jgi:hypothetical protein
MGRSNWSYEASGIVDATPEAIMIWWFHRDRADDVLKFAEKIGATETSSTQEMEGEVRIRTYQWKNRRGWTFRHKTEAQLTPEGLAARRDDRFVADLGDVMTYRTPRGTEMTQACAGRIEFLPLADGSTKVKAVHNHTLDGGKWLWRVGTENRERSNTLALFRDYIARCQKSVGLSSTASPD